MKRRLQALYNRLFRRKELEAILHSAHIEPGHMDLMIEHPSVAVIASELAQFFIKAGGVNYVEFEMVDRATIGYFIVTIQRRRAASPSQVNGKLKEALEKIADGDATPAETALNVLKELRYRS